MIEIRKVRWMLAAAVLAGAPGCHPHATQPPTARKDYFTVTAQAQNVRNVLGAQAAAGAAADSTLHPVHFDGPELNSLGEERLDLMLQGQETGQPLMVYLDLPEGPAQAQQHTNVVDFLKSRGLDESRIHVENGINPKSHNSAAESSKALQELKSAKGGAGQQGATPAGQGTAGGGNVQAAPMSP